MNNYFSADEVLKILLFDQTTKKNILWATDDYENISADEEIQLEQINLIRPRYKKNLANKKNRTRNKAEIFTPSRVCDEQNNLIDESFGEIFWQDYISKTILEITCGEAPYLVSRYDSVTGEEISIENRIGWLDRKLRVVGENVRDVEDWFHWAKKAAQSIYGYEFQGDNLFLARQNIFLSVGEFFFEKYKFECDVYKDFIREIAEIISWNLWQMDGLTNTVPFSKQLAKQGNLFQPEYEKIFCRMKDWEKGEVWEFTEPKEGKECLKKVFNTD